MISCWVVPPDDGMMADLMCGRSEMTGAALLAGGTIVPRNRR
jgi:hypothetical protein